MTDTRCDGIDILQDGRVLDADDIPAHGTVDEVIAEELLAEDFCLPHIEASYGEVRDTILSDLLGMARASDDGDLSWAKLLVLLEVIGDQDVLLGYHPLDGIDDELGADDRVADTLEVVADIGGRCRKDHGVARAEEVIDI